MRASAAAGVLNATRQTGSVLGVTLFGSLVGQAEAFVTGADEALIISTGLLLAAAMLIWFGTRRSG
jgi:MFS transporter, DHA2 family, methylenomycin A resistance protein